MHNSGFVKGIKCKLSAFRQTYWQRRQPQVIWHKLAVEVAQKSGGFYNGGV
jgi:hypothetical protein